MKEKCQDYEFFQSNNSKIIVQHYNDKVDLKCSIVGKRKTIDITTLGISGYPKATPTIGLLGLENMKLCFDKQMKMLILPKQIRLGVDKVNAAYMGRIIKKLKK